MPPFSEQFAVAAILLSGGLAFFSVVAVIYAVARRARREREIEALDAFRREVQEALSGLLAGEISYETARERLSCFLRGGSRAGMGQVLLEFVPAGGSHVQRLLSDFGFLDHWRQGLRLSGGQRLFEKFRIGGAFARARCAHHLGVAGDRASCDLLVERLRDPSPEMRRVALRSLAAIGAPESLPAIVEQIQDVSARASGVFSDREIIAALARFPLRFCGSLASWLHAGPRLQRLALDVLIQMTAAAPAWLEDQPRGGEIAGLLISQAASSADAEIRAGAATLLASAREKPATERLRRLSADPVWFVRMRAVRSLSRRLNPSHLALSLTDAHWRVREAAAYSMIQSGSAGVDETLRVFTSTADAYARDQIVEALEVSGELAGIVRRCAQGANGRELAALQVIGAMHQARAAASGNSRQSAGPESSIH